MMRIINMADGTMPILRSVRALVADVDGTLVTKEKVLTQRAIEAVRRLRENGKES